MDAWLSAIEASALAEGLRASFVLYPLVNAFHILAAGALVTTVLMLDIRVLGGFKALAFDPFATLMRRAALLGFTGAALSGLALFSVRATDYVGNVAFLAKLGLIALAGANFLLLARAGRGKAEAAAMRIAAWLSLLLWPAVLVAGRFIGFLE